jgi:hypothetical protein
MPLVRKRPSPYGQTQTEAAAAAAIEKLRNELKMAKRNIQIL